MEEAAETSAGMTRRTLIKRGAVVGGTLMWAAPVIDSFTSPAFGQVGGTPLGKDLSYVAFIYSCGGVTQRIKFDLNDDGTVEGECDTGNEFQTPGGCTLGSAQAGGGQCEDFQVVPLPGGQIRVEFSDPETTCVFVSGVGKCGSPQNPPSEGECVDGVVADGGGSITFGTCSPQA